MNNRAHASIHQVADEAGKANVAFRLLVDAVQDYAIFLLDQSGHVASGSQPLADHGIALRT